MKISAAGDSDNETAVIISLDVPADGLRVVAFERRSSKCIRLDTDDISPERRCALHVRIDVDRDVEGALGRVDADERQPTDKEPDQIRVGIGEVTRLCGFHGFDFVPSAQ